MGLKRALCCGVWTILRLCSVLAYFAIGYVFKGLLASRLMSLGKLPDVQRGITRIFLRTATAAEVRLLRLDSPYAIPCMLFRFSLREEGGFGFCT
jgi:hypothetical protein